MSRTVSPSAPGLPFAASLCHRCRAGRALISGRGSVFLLCTARPEKYLPQPVRRCPVFAPAPLVEVRGPDGAALLRWWAAPLAEPLALRADGHGGLLGPLPPGSPGVAPGDALWRTADGARLDRAPSRGALLGWVLSGAERLAAWPAGAPVVLTAG